MKVFRNKTIINSILNSARLPFGRSLYIQRPGEGNNKRVTVIPGQGIGIEITQAVQSVFEAIHVPIVFDTIENFSFTNKEHQERLAKNKVILLGIPPTTQGQIITYYDFYIRLGLFAEVVNAFSVPGIKSRHKNVDIVIIRERMQGEYSGIEHEVFPGVIESIKVSTKDVCLRLAEYAFEFATLSGRKKVTAVHKANIMKLVDGNFLSATREIAQKYPQIKYDEMIIDNTSMQLVKNPSQFDVMVMPNLYGLLVSNICAGITGGVGLTPGCQIGKDHALFSQGTRHSGYGIAGKNLANPTALLYSSCMMLRHMNLSIYADRIQTAINTTLIEGKTRTKDIGGTATTTEFTQEVISNLDKKI